MLLLAHMLDCYVVIEKEMFKENLSRLEKIHAYLTSKESDGIISMKALATTLKKENVQLVLLTFPHENIEVLGKINGDWKLFDSFAGVISHDEIYEVEHYSYKKENKLANFKYWLLVEYSRKLIRLWIATCFHKSGIGKEINIPFYFKDGYDSMEILYINELFEELEKSEFENYFLLNKDHTIDLIQTE